MFAYLPDKTRHDICQLLDLIVGLFPSAYNSVNGEEGWRRLLNTWSDAFIQAGIIKSNGFIDLELFQRGKDYLPFFNSQYMPSCPQFINFCINPLEINTQDELL